MRRLSGIKSPLPHFRFLVRGHRSEYRTGFLIKGPTVMPVPADSAVSYWLAIVHSVLDRLDRAQIRKDALQIFVGHVTEIPPWHDGIEFARAHFARAHDFQEHRFVVITDAGRIGRQIRAGHLREGIWCYEIPTCKLKAGKRPAIFISQSMAPLTGAKLHQIRASLYGR